MGRDSANGKVIPMTNWRKKISSKVDSFARKHLIEATPIRPLRTTQTEKMIAVHDDDNRPVYRFTVTLHDALSIQKILQRLYIKGWQSHTSPIDIAFDVDYRPGPPLEAP